LLRRFIIVGLILLICLGSAAYADSFSLPGSSPATLTILTPFDQSLNKGLNNIAKEYGKDHNTIINIVSVKGRKKIIEEITSNNTSADLVVIEKEYPLFDLKGLKTLENKGLIDKSEKISSSEADLIVSKDSKINSLSDLNGTKFAAVDLVNYHMPGGCLANSVFEALPSTPVVVNQSGINAIYEAVVNSSADATVMWKSDYLAQKDKGEVKVIPIPEYGMDNYIAILKSSSNPSEAATFMDYVVAHKDELSE
jgi:ABC-type molybdate transport system substrate-binding protein